MIRTEPNYREIADAVGEINEQIKALQGALKDIYGNVRDDHGKKIADQLKLAIKLNAMDGEKRIERDEIEEGAFRILSILQTPRAPRATRVRENIEKNRPADGGANITMTHTAIATHLPPHDADGVIIETELGADPKSSLETSSDRHEPDASPVVVLPDPSPSLAHDGEPQPSSAARCAKSGETSPLAVGQVGPRPGSHGVSKAEQAVTISDADVPAFLKSGKAA